MGIAVAPVVDSAAAVGTPEPISRFTRLRSARSSDAVWHRVSRSFSSVLRMACSSDAGRSGRSWRGATGD